MCFLYWGLGLQHIFQGHAFQHSIFLVFFSYIHIYCLLVSRWFHISCLHSRQEEEERPGQAAFLKKQNYFSKSLTHLPLILIGQNWVTRSPVAAREFRNIDI